MENDFVMVAVLIIFRPNMTFSAFNTDLVFKV